MSVFSEKLAVAWFYKSFITDGVHFTRVGKEGDLMAHCPYMMLFCGRILLFVSHEFLSDKIISKFHHDDEEFIFLSSTQTGWVTKR